MASGHEPARLAYVLCAGAGIRLRPLTRRLPKALLPVSGRPMVFHVLDGLRAHGIRRFVVNLHAHPDLLHRALRGYARQHGISIAFVVEPRLLDTGGAILNAETHLCEPFWLLNCDIGLAGISLSAIESRHHRQKNAATLAVRPMLAGELFNPVGVDRRGRLVRVSGVFGRGGRDHVFLGIHRIEPDALRFLSRTEKIFPIFGGLYRNLHAAGKLLAAHVCHPALDIDLGTLEGYYAANLTI